MSGNFSWPGPRTPDMPSQTMPQIAFNAQIQMVGQTFGWMKAHTCPCTGAAGPSGTPDPYCLTCEGRGVYWDPPLDFVGYVTYMHTSSAPDEPGGSTNAESGEQESAQPTLTIPVTGLLSESTVYNNAGEFDAYVEYDNEVRFETPLVSQDGRAMSLPYQFNLRVLAVTTYDVTAHTVTAVASGGYTVVDGALSCPSFPNGTGFVVEYTALPIYVAFRSAGGLPHNRPFAQGRAMIPKRFHLTQLDAWLRARGGGDGPNTFARATST